MTLYDLIEYINDSSIVVLYDSNHEKIAWYDGKESIPEEYNDCNVWDIFPDRAFTNISAIGIEIDYESPDYIQFE